MPKFITNIARDFLNIYVEEDDIRRAYGDDYADRYSNINPKTGKKTVSATKVLVRVFIVFMTFLCLFLLVRILTYGG